ncbi:hypothetical protein [Pseudoduganella ginsengisoli]|nr:hypothetical protein [Pseudoduganella ginsengisoli]
MNSKAQWLLAMLLAAVSAWALWAMQQPDMVHQLAMLGTLC